MRALTAVGGFLDRLVFGNVQRGNIDAQRLIDSVTAGGHQYAFCIIYSILTYRGTFTSQSSVFSPAYYSNLVGKIFENGHAQAAFVDVANQQVTVVEIGELEDDRDGWVISDYDHDEQWAAQTPSSTTHIYYVNEAEVPTLAADFARVRLGLEADNNSWFSRPVYAAITPNNPLDILGAPKHNCVSTAHYVASQMGLGWMGAQQSGWWIPSVSSWMTWLASAGTAWKTHTINHCNCYLA